MIVRIVKMTFVEEKVDDFLDIFENSKEKIKGFKGCRHLELLIDVQDEQVYLTYSVWDSENDLSRYRKSELFRHTWLRTKKLFADKPAT